MRDPLYTELTKMSYGLSSSTSLFINCIFLSIFISMAFFSMGFAQKLLMKITNEEGGKNDKAGKIQGKYLDKHISYVSVCIILWALFQSISFY